MMIERIQRGSFLRHISHMSMEFSFIVNYTQTSRKLQHIATNLQHISHSIVSANSKSDGCFLII